MSLRTAISNDDHGPLKIPENGDYLVDVPPAAASPTFSTISTTDTDKMLERMIAQRTRLLMQHLSGITGSIHQRQILTESTQQQIDIEICRTRTELYQPGFFPTQHETANRRIVLEDRIADLYKERRHQDVLLWQDTTALHRERRTVEKELRTAVLDLWMARYVGGEEPTLGAFLPNR